MILDYIIRCLEKTLSFGKIYLLFHEIFNSYSQYWYQFVTSLLR